MKLIWRVGGWNEHFERLEGMLFGYEDWQNDWWINEWTARRGGIDGIPLCCAVTAAGLAWIETAGFRACRAFVPDTGFHMPDESKLDRPVPSAKFPAL